MMRFYANSDIVFGRGSLQQLPELLRPWKAEKVMVVSDPGVTAAGIAGNVQNILEQAGLNTLLYSEVQANPTNENVNQAAALAKGFKPELLVAVGGGSSIDLAKAVSLLMTNAGPIELYGGIGNVPRKGLPLVAIPTTSGTSSEITNVCALIDTQKVVKYVIIDNKLTPDLVVADPELTKTVPARVTAATGMDAITHAIESYISRKATPLSEYHSLQGLKILYQNLPVAYENGRNLLAREQMMLGCFITGFGFSNANLGLVHGIAHTLSAHFGIAHGAANAAVLPYVLSFNAPSCPQKMIDMATLLSLPLTRERNRDQYVLANAMEKLVDMMKIPRLSAYGITEADFEMLTEDILRESVLAFNPRQDITGESIQSILRQAL